jgi:hypothetical protein
MGKGSASYRDTNAKLSSPLFLTILKREVVRKHNLYTQRPHKQKEETCRASRRAIVVVLLESKQKTPEDPLGGIQMPEEEARKEEPLGFERIFVCQLACRQNRYEPEDG